MTSSSRRSVVVPKRSQPACEPRRWPAGVSWCGKPYDRPNGRRGCRGGVQQLQHLLVDHLQLALRRRLVVVAGDEEVRGVQVVGNLLLALRVNHAGRQPVLGHVQGGGDGSVVHRRGTGRRGSTGSGRWCGTAPAGRCAGCTPASQPRIHQLVPDEGLQEAAADRRPTRHPQDQPRPGLLADGEQLELPAAISTSSAPGMVPARNAETFVHQWSRSPTTMAVGRASRASPSRRE